MPAIKYVGPFADGVVLPTLGVQCAKNATINVTDEVFANLVEQSDWEAVTPKSKSATVENGAQA